MGSFSRTLPVRSEEVGLDRVADTAMGGSEHMVRIWLMVVLGALVAHFAGNDIHYSQGRTGGLPGGPEVRGRGA
jgi:hypothetical protein